MSPKTRYTLLGALCMLLFTVGVLWGVSTQAKTKGDTATIAAQEDQVSQSAPSDNLNPGTLEKPQTTLSSITAIVADLNAKHVSYWIDEPGWYYYEYEKIEPGLNELTLPNTDLKLTSQHTIERVWLSVNADNNITSQVTISSEPNGTVLQEAVSIDGTFINLTGYNNPVLRNTATSTDDLYNVQVRDHYLLVELLETLPQGSHAQAWLDESTDPAQYVIQTTQNTGELPPILTYTFKLNYETGQINHWEGGHISQEGTYTPILTLQNFQYLSTKKLPESISTLMTEANSLLKEGQ